VPKPRKRPGKSKQDSFIFEDQQGHSSSEQEYNPTPIINEIRSHVESWRALPNSADWGVKPETARLLSYWRIHDFQGVLADEKRERNCVALEAVRSRPEIQCRGEGAPVVIAI
jgi:hypothetical protein